jgi:hypothetical protein
MFGWLRRNHSPKNAAAPNPDRYAEKPLLILLENYVLDCIGVLTPDKQASIAQIVERVYGPGPDWKRTLRATLHLDDSLDESLRELWVKNQQIASDAGQSLQPVDFARMIVDENFSKLIG